MLTPDWLKVEDIQDQLYINRHTISEAAANPRPIGTRQPGRSKCLTGGVLVALLIFVIWFPLLLMSALQTHGAPNTPVTVSLTVAVDVYEPLFAMTTLQTSPHVSDDQYAALLRRDSSGFVALFQAVVRFSSPLSPLPCLLCLFPVS